MHRKKWQRPYHIKHMRITDSALTMLILTLITNLSIQIFEATLWRVLRSLYRLNCKLCGPCWGTPAYPMERGCSSNLQHTLPFICVYIRLFYDFWGFTTMYNQNDTSRDNANTKYFWVISRPALNDCRQFLRFVCLALSKRSYLPQEGYPAVRFSNLFTVMLSDVGFFFCC